MPSPIQNIIANNSLFLFLLSCTIFPNKLVVLILMGSCIFFITFSKRSLHFIEKSKKPQFSRVYMGFKINQEHRRRVRHSFLVAFSFPSFWHLYAAYSCVKTLQSSPNHHNLTYQTNLLLNSRKRNFKTDFWKE